ncbi:MAG TPA: hypothetical protein VMI31_19295 [Fimbriimonadaceae bacterium]|nr:hypothetical protein [Fimbriimonadaceae bacterium]
MRRLAPSPDWSNVGAIQRIFRYGAKLFVVDGHSLLRLERDGSCKFWTDLPFGTVGLAGNRWLILCGETGPSPAAKVVSIDLSTGRRREIVSEPYSNGVSVFPDSPYVLVADSTPDGHGDLAVRADTGVKTPIPSGLKLIGSYGYCDNIQSVEVRGTGTGGVTAVAPPSGRFILVYSLQSGSLIQKLKIPTNSRY